MFENKVVWITGASSGIGEALALEFAREGAFLVLSARRENELKRVAELTGLSPEKVLVLPMDMLEISHFPSKIQQVLDTFGHIDILIQNAGVSQRSLIKATNFQVYRDIMEIDYFSIVALTKAVLPVMISNNSGHFVAISSVAGKIGTPYRSGYCGAKHALIGFFDSLRAECFKDHISVTTICPGYIKTAISLNAVSGDGQKHGRMDQNQAKGMEADVCARKILKAVKNKKNEVFVGGFYEGLGLLVKRFFPSLLFKMVRNVNVN
ncbi:Short-chain dehydrogenase [Pseudarcicella hirudinis]|uniref:Short-chain dehydrogenase n=1 Tax=Pseudarcicella hirudinis TaxID=1079859 RepID=A0A1I5UJW2_9BACT|nr:SDR family oxidoreductase [Pseudarcicella hirudinis]SFP95327.1 Short-chain dehydrogenase [Pseudarcicella hirudinis]